MRAVVEIWLKSLIDEFTLGGLHSAMVGHSNGSGLLSRLLCSIEHLVQVSGVKLLDGFNEMGGFDEASEVHM